MDRKKPNRTEQDQVKAEEDQIGTNQTKLDRRGPNGPSKTKNSRMDQQNQVKTKDDQMD